MKKILLVAALIAFSSQAYAADVFSALDAANSKVTETQAKIDSQKAKAQAKQDALTAKVQAKQDAAAKKAADKKAKQDAKQAETAAKVNTLKTNINNLTNSLTVTK